MQRDLRELERQIRDINARLGALTGKEPIGGSGGVNTGVNTLAKHALTHERFAGDDIGPYRMYFRGSNLEQPSDVQLSSIPNSRVVVAGPMDTETATYRVGQLSIYDDSDPSDTPVSGITFGGFFSTKSPPDAFTSWAGIYGEKENSTSGNTAGMLTWWTRVNAGTGLGFSEKMRLTSDGSLGIGETAPGSLLTVAGNASIGSGFSTTAAPTGGLIVEGNVGIGTTTSAAFAPLLVERSGTGATVIATFRTPTSAGDPAIQFSDGTIGPTCFGLEAGIVSISKAGTSYVGVNIGDGNSANEQLDLNGRLALRESTTPGATANSGKLYTKDVSSIAELFYSDDVPNEIQLTSGGFISPGAIDTTANYTWSGAHTFNGSFTAGDMTVGDLTSKDGVDEWDFISKKRDGGITVTTAFHFNTDPDTGFPSPIHSTWRFNDATDIMVLQGWPSATSPSPDGYGILGLLDNDLTTPPTYLHRVPTVSGPGAKETRTGSTWGNDWTTDNEFFLNLSAGNGAGVFRVTAGAAGASSRILNIVEDGSGNHTATFGDNTNCDFKIKTTAQATAFTTDYDKDEGTIDVVLTNPLRIGPDESTGTVGDNKRRIELQRAITQAVPILPPGLSNNVDHGTFQVLLEPSFEGGASRFQILVPYQDGHVDIVFTDNGVATGDRITFDDTTTAFTAYFSTVHLVADTDWTIGGDLSTTLTNLAGAINGHGTLSNFMSAAALPSLNLVRVTALDPTSFPDGNGDGKYHERSRMWITQDTIDTNSKITIAAVGEDRSTNSPRSSSLFHWQSGFGDDDGTSAAILDNKLGSALVTFIGNDQLGEQFFVSAQDNYWGPNQDVDITHHFRNGAGTYPNWGYDSATGEIHSNTRWKFEDGIQVSDSSTAQANRIVRFTDSAGDHDILWWDSNERFEIDERAQMAPTFTGVLATAADTGLDIYYSWAPDTTSSVTTMKGVNAWAEWASGGSESGTTKSSVIGGSFSSRHAHSTGTITDMIGGQFLAQCLRAAPPTISFTITNMIAGEFEIQHTGRNITSTSIYGVKITDISSLGTGGSSTNLYGLHLGDFNNLATNNYALFLTAQTGGSATKGNIYADGGDWDDGHIQLNTAHAWATSGHFRVNDSAPTSATDYDFNVESTKVEAPNEMQIGGDLNHDGSNIGFFGTAPAAQAAAYSVTNVTTDRTYDADSTTTAELADVLGTLIADLQSYGLLQ